jgi:hypothetical protein
MITGEQGAGKLASPVREETDGKGPGQGHLVGGRLHSEGGRAQQCARAARPVRAVADECAFCRGMAMPRRAVVYFFLAPGLLRERSALRTMLRRKSY